MTRWLRSTLGVFMKDLRSEIRTRYAINALVMFVVMTLSIILFSFSHESIPLEMQAALLWIVVFFTAMSGLSRTFVSEEERGTVMTLQILARASSVYFGKLFTNILLSLALNILTVVLFILLINTFIVRTWSVFLLMVVLGSIGFAAATTIVAARIAKAGMKGTLFSVLSFPVLLPLLLTVISGTKMALEGVVIEKAGGEIQLLVSYIVVFIALSTIVFDYIWEE